MGMSEPSHLLSDALKGSHFLLLPLHHLSPQCVRSAGVVLVGFK